MLDDPQKAGRVTNGLVSALYFATVILLALLLYFSVRNIQDRDSLQSGARTAAPNGAIHGVVTSGFKQPFAG